EKKLKPFMAPPNGGSDAKGSLAGALERFELPIHFRAWTTGGKSGQEKRKARKAGRPSGASLGNLTDGLPFPLLASAVLGGATYAAHAVLNDRRAFVDGFAARVGRTRPAGRVLWLTDTLCDKNGVSHALQ